MSRNKIELIVHDDSGRPIRVNIHPRGNKEPFVFLKVGTREWLQFLPGTNEMKRRIDFSEES